MTTTENAAAEVRICLCGCGENIPSHRKANYRPGHDARHAAQVGQAMFATPDHQVELWDDMLSFLPTEALRDKARKRAATLRAAAEQKAAREAQKVAPAQEPAPAPRGRGKATKTVGKAK